MLLLNFAHRLAYKVKNTTDPWYQFLDLHLAAIQLGQTFLAVFLTLAALFEPHTSFDPRTTPLRVNTVRHGVEWHFLFGNLYPLLLVIPLWLVFFWSFWAGKIFGPGERVRYFLTNLALALIAPLPACLLCGLIQSFRK